MWIFIFQGRRAVRLAAVVDCRGGLGRAPMMHVVFANLSPFQRGSSLLDFHFIAAG